MAAASSSTFLSDYPQLDEVESRTWVYPDDDRFEFRSYQHSMARSALADDVLVSIPTGTGKTLIAAVVMRNFLRWFPDGLVVFLAMTRPLVQQQIRASCMSVGLSPETEAQFMTGEDPPQTRGKKWSDATQSSARLIFCTPHILKNDLDKGLLDARRIVCCVFDEAHHAGGGERTPYAQVARLLRQAQARCRMLALSATAGSTLGKVQTVIDMLALSKIEVRTEETLESYMHGRQIKIVTVKEPSFAQRHGSNGGGKAKKAGGAAKAGRSGGKWSMRELLLLPAESVYMRLHSLGALQSAKSELALVSEADLSGCLEWIQQRAARDPSGAQTSTWFGWHSHLAAYKALADAALGPTADVTTDGKRASERRAAIDRCLAGVEDFGLQGQRLSELRSLAYGAASGDPNDDKWLRLVPKLRTLVELLHSHFGKHPDSRVIAFVSRRATVSALCAQLADAPETRGLVRARAFVGRGNKADATGAAADGMDQAAQQRVLDGFKAGLEAEGGCNVLVATCVAEEGLDIGEVDLIVCFDTVSSPIRLVQRLGRTGRQREGEAVLLLTEKEKREYEQTAIQAKKLADAVDQGKGIRVKPPAAPLLPHEPTCSFFKPQDVLAEKKAQREAEKEAAARPKAAARAPPAAAKPTALEQLLRPAAAPAAASLKRPHEAAAEAAAPKDLLQAMAESSSDEDEEPLDRRQKVAMRQEKAPLATATASHTNKTAVGRPAANPAPRPLPTNAPIDLISDEEEDDSGAGALKQEAKGQAEAAAIDEEDAGRAPAAPELLQQEEAAAPAAVADGAGGAPPVARAPPVLVSPWSSRDWLTQEHLDAFVQTGTLPPEMLRSSGFVDLKPSSWWG